MRHLLGDGGGHGFALITKRAICRNSFNSVRDPKQEIEFLV